MAAMLGFIALAAATCHLAPHLSRRDIFFGVTVPRDFAGGPIARGVSRRYAVEIWLLALAAAALVATSPMPVVSGGMLFAQALGAWVAFMKARDKVLPFAAAPSTIREAEIGPRPRLPGGLLAQIGPFAILLASAAFVALNWDDLPARVPTHWNLAGNPDGWTTVSEAGVFRGLSVGLVICATLWFMSYSVVNWTRLPRVTGQEGEQSRRARRVNLTATLASEYLIALLFAWVSTVAWFAGEGARPHLPLPFRVAPFALLLIGGGAIRATRRVVASDGPPVGDTTPDARWIVGRLYFNHADPALFVEKRSGLGYTLNLGNPWSWLVIGVVGGTVALLLGAVP